MASDIDPTLCTAEPAREVLDDGFSPPQPEAPDDIPDEAANGDARFMLGSKSPF